jgi:uncharacterized membrane protein (UPF0136 family)
MQILMIIYSCILFSGAYFGLKAGSKISFYVGIVMGMLILASVYLTQKAPFYGFLCATVTSGFLSLVFFIRLIKTRKFMPAGILFAISMLVLITNWIQMANF